MNPRQEVAPGAFEGPQETGTGRRED